MSTEDLYTKLFNILLVLRDTRDHFRAYSATDIKSLIKRGVESKTKVPKPLKDLYELEKIISDLRNAFLIERTINLEKNSASVKPQDPDS
jgi:hypothetical protein